MQEEAGKSVDYITIVFSGVKKKCSLVSQWKLFTV